MLLIVNGVIVASSIQYIFFAEEWLHVVRFLYSLWADIAIYYGVKSNLSHIFFLPDDNTFNVIRLRY